MDHSAKSISELLLERLRESAALEAAEEAEPPPGLPVEPLPAPPRVDIPPGPGRTPDRSGARRAYGQAAGAASRPLGSG